MAAEDSKTAEETDLNIEHSRCSAWTLNAWQVGFFSTFTTKHLLTESLQLQAWG